MTNQTHTVELTDQEAYDAIEMLDHYADEMDVDRADELADKIEAAMNSDGGNAVPPGTPRLHLNISEDSVDPVKVRREMARTIKRIGESYYGR